MKFLEDIADAIEDVAEGIGDAIEAHREKQRARARHIAEPLGLEVDRYARIVGSLRGVPVERWSKDHDSDEGTDWWTHTTFALPVPLPPSVVARHKHGLDLLAEAFGTEDLQLGSDLDPTLWIRAPKRREDTVRRLLTHPEVEAALRALVDDEIRLALQGQTLKLRFRGHHLDVGDRGFDEGVRLVQALEAVIIGPWEEAAETYGLTLNEARTQLSGHHDGIPVLAEVRPPEEDRPLRTWVIGWIDPPLPEDTVVAHEQELPSGQTFDDPILGRMLRAHSSDLEALERQLGTDEARGLLLEILHGHRNSRLYADRVALSVVGHVGVDLGRYLEDVVALARVLRGEGA